MCTFVKYPTIDDSTLPVFIEANCKWHGIPAVKCLQDKVFIVLSGE